MLFVAIPLIMMVISIITKGFVWLLRLPNLIDGILLAVITVSYLGGKYTFTDKGPLILGIAITACVFLISSTIEVAYWILSAISTVFFGIITWFLSGGGTGVTIIAIIIWLALRLFAYTVKKSNEE